MKTYFFPSVANDFHKLKRIRTAYVAQQKHTTESTRFIWRDTTYAMVLKTTKTFFSHVLSRLKGMLIGISNIEANSVNVHFIALTVKNLYDRF